MKKFLIVVVLVSSFFKSQAQQDCDVPGNYCLDNITIQTCSGVLFDAGGGNAYPDQTFTMTICPDTPGDVIQLDFTAFSLQTSPNASSSDYLSIFDGDNVNEASLGDNTGNSLQGLQVTGTVNNTTGCLTLVFTDNGTPNVNSPGFQANIQCTTPCANPTAGFSVTAPSPAPMGGNISTCIGTPITLNGSASFPEPGFTISEYVWNFDNGTVDNTSGAEVTYNFDEPGEYLVSLTVLDNNGCASLNVNPVQVLVSTQPDFSSIAQIGTQYCFGQNIILNSGNIEYPTWSSLPPQVVAGTTELADGAGFSYSSPITFDFFDSDAVLENCEDFLELFVNIEHSFLGDLSFTVSCPNGTIVDLQTYPNDGGGDYLGEPIDDGTAAIGVGYDYGWSSTSTLGFIDESTLLPNGAVPPGIYQPEGDLCALVGCPLNGTWTFTATDNIPIDNGYIFSWGINFNPALYPGVTTFTPTAGGGADSSYWTGTNFEFIDPNADIIELTLTEPGTYEYTYEVTNNFGCISDTTISITIDEPVQITAGPDFTYACAPVVIQGGYLNEPTPACGADAGSYSFCYGENENYTETFCPDTPGDGVSVMELTFSQGSLEVFFDDITFYDGQTTAAPILAGPMDGDISGMTFTATNLSGCITMQITSDGSNSCESGGQDELQYEVGCADPNNFTWEWTPSGFLSSSSSPAPTLDGIDQTTLYVLSGYPTGFPECAVSDDVLVTVNSTLGMTLPNNYLGCAGATIHINPPTIIGGAEPFVYSWIGSDGSTYNTAEFDVVVGETPVEYCLTLGDACGLEVEDCITVNRHPVIPATFDVPITNGCEPLNVSMQSDYTAFQNVASMEWEFGDGNSTIIMGSSNHQYQVEGEYYPILTITDVFGCVYTDTANSPVLVFPRPLASFNVFEEQILLPNTTFQFFNTSIDANIFEYRFQEFGTSASPDTSFTFPAETAATYLVELVASNQFGCIDSTTRQVTVRNDIDIYIPNTFTPDGDGINDVWKIEGKGFVNLNYKIVIFNRWGEPVFTSTDPNEAWLGEHQNGEYFNQDSIYLYYLEIQDEEYDIKYTYDGHILLLR